MSHPHPLATVSVVAADVRASVAFYRAVGLDIPEESIWVDDGVAHHVTVKDPAGVNLDIDSLALTQRWDPAAADAPASGRTIITFALPSVAVLDALHDSLVSDGYASHVAPFDAFWGQRYAVVLDPDGNRVGLACSNP